MYGRDADKVGFAKDDESTSSSLGRKCLTLVILCQGGMHKEQLDQRQGNRAGVGGLLDTYMTVYDFSVSRLSSIEQRVPDAYSVVDAGGHDLLASHWTEPG